MEQLRTLKINVRWIREGSQNSKYHWNSHKLFLFSVCLSPGVVSKTARNLELYKNWQKELSERSSFSGMQRRQGRVGPFGSGRVKGNPFCFCIALIFFYSLLLELRQFVAACCRVEKLKPWLSSQRTNRQNLFTSPPTSHLSLLN